MPGPLQGFAAAIIASVTGFVIATILNQTLPTFGSTGWIILALFNILSIVLAIESLQHTNYWSITYLGGYLFGLLTIGKFFLEWYEMMLYLGAGIFYLVLKLSRKLD
jgi:hypothetical protein